MERCGKCGYVIPWYSETCLNGHDKIRRRPTKEEKAETQPYSGSFHLKDNEIVLEEIAKSEGVTRQAISLTEIKLFRKLKKRLARMEVRSVRDLIEENVEMNYPEFPILR
jgi:hypothetical protein